MGVFNFWRCRIGAHGVPDKIIWNDGHYFGKCPYCQHDIISLKMRKNWQSVPKGMRVVWRSMSDDHRLFREALGIPSSETARREYWKFIDAEGVSDEWRDLALEERLPYLEERAAAALRKADADTERTRPATLMRRKGRR